MGEQLVGTGDEIGPEMDGGGEVCEVRHDLVGEIVLTHMDARKGWMSLTRRRCLGARQHSAGVVALAAAGND